MKTKNIALLAALFIPYLASANLVTNGSFEMPMISSVSSQFFVLFPDGSTAIDGWTVVAGDDPDPLDRRMDLTGGVANWLAASDGNQLIDLASTQGFNKGLQSIPINVISGQTYTLTFDIGNFYIYRSNVGVSFSTGEWSDGTTGEKQFLNTAGPIFDGTTNWKTITLTWVAKNTTSTQISFFGRDPKLPNTANANYDENPFLDNVDFSLNSITKAYTGHFNQDGKSDILWRNEISNNTFVDLMGGVTGATAMSRTLISQPALNSNWQVAGTGDFNNDGHADILWRNYVSNNTFVDLMGGVTGATAMSRVLISQPANNTNWQVAGTGDFNGDKVTDILWRNYISNNTFVDLMGGITGATVTSRNLISQPALNSNWQVAGTGDFNHDGYADILWRDYISNNTLVDLMGGATVMSRTLISQPANNTNWQIAGTDDFNNDGHADILWRDYISNNTLVDLMGGITGATVMSRTLISQPANNTNWQVAGTGDFNNDGYADILWRDYISNNTLVDLMGGITGATVMSRTPTTSSAP